MAIRQRIKLNLKSILIEINWILESIFKFAKLYKITYKVSFITAYMAVNLNKVYENINLISPTCIFYCNIRYPLNLVALTQMNRNNN